MKRSKRKGPFFSNCLDNFKRNTTITKFFNNKNLKIYNGYTFNSFIISKKSFYFKLGSFVPTRKTFRFKNH
uniref:Ribosomal protein S19 n=1 Tax=Coscinodiscus granii TaxID=265552 RepID=A0A8A6W3G4_9STRA|nr:ribosomal protein S19 [Coscinodiscus granii]QTK21679.1 ribosomal protein S19 [Coscinodiscus granii]